MPPRITQKQIQHAERMEYAKQLLKKALKLPEGKNPEMQNVQKLVSLLIQPEYGVDYDEKDAVKHVVQKRAERKSFTKKGKKPLNLPVRNGPYQTRSRTRNATMVKGSNTIPSYNTNLKAEFRSYYGVPKTPKMSKKNYVSVVPEELTNISSENRINFYKNMARNAYKERYGRIPSEAMTAKMAKLQNQGYSDENIFATLKSRGKTMKNNARPVTMSVPMPVPSATPMYKNTRPVPSAPPMNQTMRRSSRIAKKKMTACDLCELEKQDRLSPQEKDLVAQIGEKIQSRRNQVPQNPFDLFSKTVTKNPFD